MQSTAVPVSPRPTDSFDSTPSLPDIPLRSDHAADDALHSDGFDAEMLQAVVGDLPHATLLKLKDASGSDVQRGTYDQEKKYSH